MTVPVPKYVRRSERTGAVFDSLRSQIVDLVNLGPADSIQINRGFRRQVWSAADAGASYYYVRSLAHSVPSV